MIPDFNSRFDTAFDLRLYQQAKGYVDASPDAWEYLVWQPIDPYDTEAEPMGYEASADDSEEF